MRYFLELRYRGTNYHGWQRQPNAPTIQSVLEEGLSTILREPIRVQGAGRTDAGVHALQQFAHFDSQQLLDEQLLTKLNGWLPWDIAALNLYRPVREDLHARFDAIGRGYVYRIMQRKDPFERERALRHTQPLDRAAMQAAADALYAYENFASFEKAHGGNQTSRCNVTLAAWEQSGPLLTFHIEADRFLRGMVRAIVGTLLDVGTHKRTVADFRAIIEAQDRSQASMNAAAHGLYLQKVAYPAGCLIAPHSEVEKHP